jgi:hypothetical protein
MPSDAQRHRQTQIRDTRRAGLLLDEVAAQQGGDGCDAERVHSPLGNGAKRGQLNP